MKKAFPIFIFTSVIILYSCKKSDTPQNTEPDIPLSFDTTTVILNQSKESFIKEVHPTYMVVAGKNLGAARGTGNVSAINLHEQGIFLSAPNSKFPQGSFEKIQSISPLPNGDFRIGFTPYDPLSPLFSICDALEAGSHIEAYPVTNKVDKVTDDLGNVLPISFDGGKLKIEVTKKWDWDGIATTTNDSVEVSGIIKTNLDLNVDLRVKNWKVEKFKTEIKLKYDGELKAKISLPLLDEKKSWNIYSIYLQPVTVLVGGVFPIVLNPVIKINANISAKGEISLEGTLIKYAADFSKGIEYTNTEGFKVIGTENFPPLSTAIAPALTASFEGEFKVSPEFALDVRLYNKNDISISAGLGLYGKAKLTAEASTTNPGLFDLNAEIKLGMEGKVKGKLKIFNKEIADKEISFTIAEITLWDQKKFIQNWNPINNTNSLIAYYPFNGNANDESGNNRNGTIMNTPTFNSGISGQSVKLTGRCDYGWCEGDLGDHILIPMPQFNSMNSFSLNIWVKEEALLHPDGSAYLSFGSGHDIYIGHYGNDIRFASSGGSVITIPYNSTNTNTFKMYSLTFDNGTLKAYQNGILVGTKLNATKGFTGTVAAIARHWSGAGTYTRFSGSIDQVRVYNKALSLTEITNLYSTQQ